MMATARLLLTVFDCYVAVKRMSSSNRHRQQQLRSRRSNPLAKANNIQKNSLSATQIPLLIPSVRYPKTDPREAPIMTERLDSEVEETTCSLQGTYQTTREVAIVVIVVEVGTTIVVGV